MDKVFTASLCNPDKDVYVILDVPAEPWAVLDARERLRLAPDTRVEWEIEDYGEFPDLFPALSEGDDFPALNALAERLAGLSEQQRTAFEGLVKLHDGKPMEPDDLIALTEQAGHCHVVPEATDDASLGRFRAANGSIPDVKDVPDKVFELLDFQLLGRRIRHTEGGIFTRQGYVAPDKSWKPTQDAEPRTAPEAPDGIFHLELRLGEERAELTLPAGQKLVEVRDQMEAVGLSNCAVTAFHSRVPQIPAAWATPERLDTLNCLAIRLTVLEDREPLKLVKYKAVLEVSPPSSLEEAMALTERMDAYSLDRSAVSPEDVARGELRSAVGEEQAALLCRYLNLYGYTKRFRELSESTARLRERKARLEGIYQEQGQVQKRLLAVSAAMEHISAELMEWDEEVIHQLLEKVTVLSREKIRVTFRDGREIEQAVNQPKRRCITA